MTTISKLGQSCTTDGIYVVQDDRTFNRVNPLRPLPMGRFQLLQAEFDRASFVSQDRELTILRWERTPISYREGVAAIVFLRRNLSCTTFFPFVVQDKENHYAT